MKMQLSHLLFILAATLIVCCAEILCSEDLINRVVIIVDDDIITLYDLHKAALWNGMEYEKMADDVKRDLVNQLINRDLVFQEINKIGGIKVDKITLDSAVESLKAKNPDPGFSASDIEEYARAQLLIQGFANQRFGPLVRVGEDEIREYYQNNIAASENSQSASPLTLAEAFDSIKTILERRAINVHLKDWLDRQRPIHKIRILEFL
jgi:hypothetical protein